MRRTWEGVLVSLIASNSLSLAGMAPVAPVREDIFVYAPSDTNPSAAEVDVNAPIVAAPAVVLTIDELAAEVFPDHFEPFPDAITVRPTNVRSTSIEEQPTLQATAVPLPPALWPGALTLAGVALAMVIRQHRRV